MILSPPRFLVDEDVHGDIPLTLRDMESTMDILVVGEAGAPPKGTLDPELLLAAETLGRTLITGDRSSMPDHLKDHFAAGHHTSGVILLRSGFPFGRYLRELHLIWFAMTADEWIDRTDYIPY